MAYIALTVDRRLLARSLAVAGAGSAAAMWMGIPLVTWIGHGPGGWRLAFAVAGALSLIVAVWVFLGLPRDPTRPRHREGRHRLKWWSLRMWVFRGRTLKPVWLANTTSIANAASFYVVYSYIGVWLSDVAGTSGPSVAGLLLMAGTGAIAGMAAAGPVSDLCGTQLGQRALVAWLVIQSMFLLVVGAYAGDSAWLWIVMFLLGVPGGSLAIIQQARVTELTPEPLQKATAAAQSMAGNGGMALAGAVGSAVIFCDATWLLPGVTIVLAIVALVSDQLVTAQLEPKPKPSDQ
jgi:DHA1 family inner membrane transport protein